MVTQVEVLSTIVVAVTSHSFVTMAQDIRDTATKLQDCKETR